MLKRIALVTGILLGSFSLTACDGIKDTFGVANRTPVIASFDYNPKSGVTKNDIITFTVVANDPEGKPLQYNWTTTKGILTANSGSTVSWRPIKSDNTFESGLTNVSVLVSDGVMTNTASVNIFINGDTITVESKPSVTTSPSPSVTVTPSVAPTVAPTPSASLAPSVTPTVAPTASASVAPSSTPSPSPSATVAPTQSPASTTSPSVTPVASPSPSASSAIIVTQ